MAVNRRNKELSNKKDYRLLNDTAISYHQLKRYKDCSSGFVVFHYPAFQLVYKRYRITFNQFYVLGCCASLVGRDSVYVTVNRILYIVHGLRSTAVNTNLNRLVDKGFLNKEKGTNKKEYVYSVTLLGKELLLCFNKEFERLMKVTRYSDKKHSKEDK